MSSFTEAILGQSRENSTDPVTVYVKGQLPVPVGSPPIVDQRAIIKEILVCNTSGADAAVSLFVDGCRRPLIIALVRFCCHPDHNSRRL